MRVCAVLVAGLMLAGCAGSSVVQVSRNQAIIETNAAPVCGTRGAMAVANQMAAVATLRAGFQRYMIAAAGAQNNTTVMSTGPTYSTTTGTFNTYGNTTYGTMNTNYGGRQFFVAGTNDARVGVVMFNPGDPGYGDALDAKTTLGPEWETKVREGIRTCS